MKVELEKITLGYSPLSESIFVGVPLKDGQWRHKQDVTNAFVHAVLVKYGGAVTVVEDNDGNKWEITVKSIK